MKLNTVTIKITETEENRRNYALNIAHLKEEELDRYYQLEALRKQCSESEAFSKKMKELQLQSLEDRDRSETELAAFQVEIQQFQGFISDQLDKFQNISKVARQRREKREEEKEARTTKVREKIAGRIQRLNNEMEEKNKEAAAMAQQLESVNERLRYFEKRFQQIASATGLTNPDAIINKFALKEEIKNELNNEIQKKKEHIVELQKHDEDVQTNIVEAKASFVDSRWKDVHELQAKLVDSDVHTRKALAEAERLEQEVALFTEGLVSLSNELPAEFAASESVEYGEGAGEGKTLQPRPVLVDLEQRLVAMAELVAKRLEEREAVRDAEKRKKEHEEKTNAIFNLSRALQTGGAPS